MSRFAPVLLEKAFFYQVNEHLQKHGLYSLNQCGYRENHSCETTLLKIVDDMQKTIHIDNLSKVLMLDLSAAFDTVDHECLLFKLKTLFKIAGNALKWFTSYLTNRTSAVVINGVYSSYRSPIFRVPVSVSVSVSFISAPPQQKQKEINKRIGL